MHTVSFSDNKKVNYASCIEEMSQLEFEHMMMLYSRQQSGEISITDFRYQLMIKVLDIRKTARYYNMTKQQREQIHYNINLLVDTLDSFYVQEVIDGNTVNRLNLNWVKQMIPEYAGYYGPADALTNCTFYEHKEAFSAYCSYLDTNDEDKLDEMIAILYRPHPQFFRLRRYFSKFDVPERESFSAKTNSLSLARRQRKVKRWPAHIKFAISQWYSNCLEYLRSGKPVIDGIEIDFSILFPQKTESTGPAGIGLMGIVFSLAETNVFGDAEKTGNSNLFDVLVRLYQLQLEYKAIKAKQNDKS